MLPEAPRKHQDTVPGGFEAARKAPRRVSRCLRGRLEGVWQSAHRLSGPPGGSLAKVPDAFRAPSKATWPRDKRAPGTLEGLGPKTSAMPGPVRDNFIDVLCFVVGLLVLLHSPRASAGNPYVTDDPSPVEYRHWEIYVASQSFKDKDGWVLTAPHVEVNYGLIPNVEIHALLRLSVSAPVNARASYGVGDTEFGLKVRLVNERKYVPMIGFVPEIEVPTGDRAAGLGNGGALLSLPIWLQKSFGALTINAGGGVWIDLGDSGRHWTLLGWLVQRRMSKYLYLGAEVFIQSGSNPGDSDDSRFNVGAVIDFSARHHLLLSAGSGFSGSKPFQSYVAYELTFAAPGDQSGPSTAAEPR